METPAFQPDANPIPTPVVGAEAVPAAPVFPAAEQAGVPTPFAAEATAPVANVAEQAAAGPERPGLFQRVAAKAGEYAAKGYSYAVAAAAEVTSPRGRVATLAFAAGAFALNAYSHRQGGGEVVSTDVLNQTADPMNVELVDNHVELPTDAGHTEVLADGGDTAPVPVADTEVLAAPTAEPSYDPLFDRNGGPTEEQGLSALEASLLVGGSVVVAGSTYAVYRNSRRARERANREGEYMDAAAVIRQRALDANAALDDRRATRRTGVPQTNIAAGNQRYNHIAYDPFTGAPYQVPVPSQDALREYGPRQAVPPPRRRRGILARAFGPEPAKPEAAPQPGARTIRRRIRDAAWDVIRWRSDL